MPELSETHRGISRKPCGSPAAALSPYLLPVRLTRCFPHVRQAFSPSPHRPTKNAPFSYEPQPMPRIFLTEAIPSVMPQMQPLRLMLYRLSLLQPHTGLRTASERRQVQVRKKALPPVQSDCLQRSETYCACPATNLSASL